MATSQDLDVLLHYLWIEDQHVYRQAHSRIQMALYLLILSYTAARIGAVVVSDAYRKSNQALKFRVSRARSTLHGLLTRPQDLKFQLSRDEDGGPPLMSLTIKFNLMKGDRDEEDKLYVLREQDHRSMADTLLALN
jgi:hypothetical protein